MSFSNAAAVPNGLVPDKCPSCGAPLGPPGPNGVAVCTYCGSTFRVPARAPPTAPTVTAAPSLPSWYNPYAGGAVPPHAIYSAPVRRKSWPALVFMVFFLVVFILPMVFTLSSLSSIPSSRNNLNTPPPTYTPPVVTINANAYGGPAPLDVTFGVVVSGGSPPYQTAYWDFGDGSSAVSNAPSHTFIYSGSYVVTVTVTDANDNLGTNQVTINVS